MCIRDSLHAQGTPLAALTLRAGACRRRPPADRGTGGRGRGHAGRVLVAEQDAELLGEQAEGGRLPAWPHTRTALAATWPIASASFLPLVVRTTASQITPLCAVSYSRMLLARHIPNGGTAGVFRVGTNGPGQSLDAAPGSY